MPTFPKRKYNMEYRNSEKVRVGLDWANGIGRAKLEICKACKERFKNGKALIKHYKLVHPGLSTDWIKE